MLRPILLSLVFVVSVVGAAAAGAPQIAEDQVAGPPSPRTVVAPNGGYRLVLEVIEQGPAPKVTGKLQRDTGETVWQRTLPQYYGPRFAFVADDGRVLLVDEWVPILSRYAVMALATDGTPVAIVGYENLAAILRRSPRALFAGAKVGPWLQAEPQQIGKKITAPTEAGAVTIDFDGRVTLVPARSGSAD